MGETPLRDPAKPHRGDRPVLTFGETMALMSADRPGPLAHASTMTLGMGGAESNVAIGLSRLGVPVVWAGRVGDDALGRLIVRELAAERVSLMPIVDTSAPTGLMIKERRTPSRQSIHYYRSESAGSRITAGDVPADLIRGASLFHATGITPALSHSARRVTLDAMRLAREAGVAVSFDLNYRQSLWSQEDARDFYSEILPMVDLLFAGEDEAAIVLGESSSPEDAARSLIARGAGSVIIKRGGEGGLSVTADATCTVPSVPIEPVDTVGAGDAFVAGYLERWLSGCGPQECLEQAVTVAAFVCLVPGDWEGLPRRDELGLLRATEPVTR